MKELTECERKLARAIESGAVVDVRTGDRHLDDPSAGGSWGIERTVRSKTLRRLVSDEATIPRAVVLRGAHVKGDLDLASTDLRCSLIFEGCSFGGQINLQDARAEMLALVNCSFGSVIAGGLSVRGGVFFDRSRGQSIGLMGAEVGAEASFHGTQLEGGEWPPDLGATGLTPADIGRDRMRVMSNVALAADRMTVGGGFFALDGFTASGAVRLSGADIRGQLVLNGAKLKNSGADALLAYGTKVARDVFCSDGFEAEGAVKLSGMSIGGQLQMGGARITGCDGFALLAEGLSVSGGVFCGAGFRSEGSVRFENSEIGGDLVVQKAALHNPPGPALFADRARVAGSILGSKLEARGEVSLAGADVGRNVHLSDAELEGREGIAFVASDVECGGNVVCEGGFSAKGGVVLSGARVRGWMSFRGAQLSNPGAVALACDGVVLQRGLQCGQGFEAEGTVDLSRADVRGDVMFRGAVLSGVNTHALAAVGLHVAGDAHFDDGFESTGHLALFAAKIDGQLNFSNATIHGREGRAVGADRISVGGDWKLVNLRVTDGPLRFPGSVVKGQVSLIGAKLDYSEGPALIADGARLVGNVLASGGFESRGTVRFRSAELGGEFAAAGAHFDGCDGVALTLERAAVRGSVLLPQITAEGPVAMDQADVEGRLILDGSSLTSPNTALWAEALRVRRGMICRDLTARGGVSMSGAWIEATLDFDGASLSGNGGAAALTGVRLRVSGNMFCQDGFEAAGGVNLAAAHIEGQLGFNRATLEGDEEDALELWEAKIDSSLWLRFASRPKGPVNLASASANVLYDDDQTWPSELSLTGLRYERVQGGPNVTVKDRLRWLRRDTAGFAPRAYEQLIASYRAAGHDREARRVAIAKRRRGRSELTRRGKVWSVFLDGTVGYGYRPWLAGLWLALLVGLGWVLFGASYPEHFAARKGTVPEFRPFLYTLDQVIPGINLGQRDAWIADGIAQWGSLLRVAGWVLATTVVAAVTGLLKRD